MTYAPRTVTTAPRIPRAASYESDPLEARWDLPALPPGARRELADAATVARQADYQRNIENFIGCVRVPVGLAGPLRVNGRDYYVPLATTEAALVASYSRGARTIREAGGCVAAVLKERVGRTPAFVFENLAEAAAFGTWISCSVAELRAVAGETTRYGRLEDVQVTIEGNHVYVALQFTTGDASGQNMVTLASDAICRHVDRHAPVRPVRWFVEANMSGDKKARAAAFASTRGKCVSAEILLPGDLIARRLHTTAAAMLEYSRISVFGAVMSGSIGAQGHYANALAALFIACGQDAGCVAEAAVGVTRFDPAGEGLYVAVTLPNLIVGTVGGGTSLPGQKACLDILGLAGPGHARTLAEVAAALALAGEVSIVGALAAGEFTTAHARLARGAGTGRGSR
jgi:hydroxymethylglutaryl-CoA reductase (NADPH)